MQKYVLALDQGTTSSRSILFDRQGRPVASAQREFPQLFPSPGHVEHDPEAIWKTQVATARLAIRRAGASPADINTIGITNQRETVVLWDRKTGRPIQNAIVWQSRITADMCETLKKKKGIEDLVRDKTGLVLDPYFSGTKIKHILDTHKGLRKRAERGEVLCGTIDTFLLWRLTGGRVHATDYSNASRTLLFNIHTLDWDPQLLALLDVPRAMLPEVRDSSAMYGHTDSKVFGAPIPISGIAGDQQAATFGQACFAPGMAKNTYGTGCFILMNTGAKAVQSSNGLLTTIAWGLNGKVTYGLEGSIFIAGAAVQWLRDGLKVIKTSSAVESLAADADGSGGVYFVPAFCGLGAPYWDPYARGTIIGLERGTTAAHLARATLESMAFQTRDVTEAMQADAGVRLKRLKVDGGACVNNALMQFQADVLGTPLERPIVKETTALGAAYLAGLATGFFKDLAQISRNWALDQTFKPLMKSAHRDFRYACWKEASRTPLAKLGALKKRQRAAHGPPITSSSSAAAT